MLVKAGLALLAIWLVGILGPFEAGQWLHFLLFGGLLFLMIGALKTREAAVERDRASRSGKQ